MQELLRKHIDPLVQIYNTMQDGIIFSDPHDDIFFINPAGAKYLGYHTSDLIGKKLENIIPDFESSKKEILKSLIVDKAFFTKGKFMAHGNSIVNTSTIITKVNNASADDLGLMTIFKDPKLEIDPPNLLDHVVFKALNARTEEIWYITDVKLGKIVFISDSIETILGWNKQEYLLGGWGYGLSRIHADDHQVIHRVNIECLALRNQVKYIYDRVPVTFDYRARHADGHYLWLHNECTVFERDDQEEVKSFIGTMRDITLQKTASLNALTKEQLRNEVIELLHGEPYLNLAFLKNFIDKNEPIAFKPEQTVKLTERELEVVKLIVAGETARQIGVRLFISEHTVNQHRKVIMKKLNARNLADMVRIALAMNLG